MTDPSKKKIEDLKKVLEGKKRDSATTTLADRQGPQKASEEETPPELVALQEKLESAEEEARQNYDKLLRVMAEFENYKKRVARDHEDRVKYSHEILLKELIPVLDDFDRLLEHLPTEEIQLIHRHFLKALKKCGLHEVETTNQMFDPHLHEALAQWESGEHPSGQIVSCQRKGYRLHDRLIRPALVTVAKAKDTNDEPPNT